VAAGGHNLAILARRRDRLSALSRDLVQHYGVGVSVYECDLGDTQARRAVTDEIMSAERTVVGLCNCAGFGTSGRFLELDLERELAMIDLNIAALVELTQVFTRPMVERRAGAVLNVASLAGFQPNPFFCTYSASKTFVQSFSEALHEELHEPGVVHRVVPRPGPDRVGRNRGRRLGIYGCGGGLGRGRSQGRRQGNGRWNP
jgi:short-subunit dehydrogenase